MFKYYLEVENSMNMNIENHYSNSQIVQIIRDNTGLQQGEAHHGLDPTMVVELIFVDPLSLILGNVLCTTKKTTSPLIN